MRRKHGHTQEPSKVGELHIEEAGADLETATREALAAVERAAGEGAAAEAESETDSQVARLQQEIADLRDRSIRTLADFDNFRKRTERERQDARRYALGEALRDFLGVADNLDLALAAGGSAEDLKRGVEITRKQLVDLLRRHGVEEVGAVGERFDPALHEAVSTEEDPAVEAPTVVAELRRGYRLHDRLLRPALVRVAVPARSEPLAPSHGPPSGPAGGGA